MRTLTLIAIAFAAYLAADVAHEGLGHGGTCIALGGRMLLLDTTYESCSIQSRWIDLAGPLVGIVVALLAWAGARSARLANLRVFCSLLFAYAAFWNLGYMIKSGIAYGGDWHFAVAGLAPAGVWHVALAVAGVALYIGAMRMLAGAWPSGSDMPSAAFALTAYVAAAALSAAGGLFDPRGPSAALTDALPSSLGSIGLVLVGLRRTGGVALPVSWAWIAAGVVSAVVFVRLLGPGLRF
ncbi:MAG: hypothetical protein JOZ72_02430 [Alphaproteobacteria bacterium]|nr:hypothetical protein [Alphaproteobacteria bacterium]